MALAVINLRKVAASVRKGSEGCPIYFKVKMVYKWHCTIGSFSGKIKFRLDEIITAGVPVRLTTGGEE